ncbi:DUF2189 domain-containing protein [Sedimentitalea nanhaiensis]|uniref:Uncharacterized membrane protein n=1 Tax=Sedimentitalea nanhaiensis TaxID=999627 RepID=A0A1I6X8X0_9RHOB|nr:DUF2189 domain-containing protein [Sedimentitalea nanhaiensis]SFT34747.1 Uncharacterized membrane protein [Sedimentitalea nanhaiensis]
MAKTIGNPVSWTAKMFGHGSHSLGSGTGELSGKDTDPIILRDLTLADLRTALSEGFQDFTALRTDVMFIVLVYPVLGVLLTWFALNRDMLPLVFPLMSGFAIIGPVAAVGLYEMSRRREAGQPTGWGDAFGIMTSPSFMPIIVLGGYLAVLFVGWMFAADTIYRLTLGPEAPQSLAQFVQDIFGTAAGWTMLIAGLAVGLVFALASLAITLVSFPLLIDRQVGLPRAVVTSVRVLRRSPVAALTWGLVVALLLALGAATLFVGLIFVLPILGHATWHLYRRAVEPHR